MILASLVSQRKFPLPHSLDCFYFLSLGKKRNTTYSVPCDPLPDLFLLDRMVSTKYRASLTDRAGTAANSPSLSWAPASCSTSVSGRSRIWMLLAAIRVARPARFLPSGMAWVVPLTVGPFEAMMDEYRGWVRERYRGSGQQPGKEKLRKAAVQCEGESGLIWRVRVWTNSGHYDNWMGQCDNQAPNC